MTSRKDALRAQIDAAVKATAPENPSRIKLVTDAINASIFTTLGLRATYSVCLDDLGIRCRLGEFELSPQMCGPVGAMFRTLTCTVYAQLAVSIAQYEAQDKVWRETGSVPPEHTVGERENLVLTYHYRYTHPEGGSNGHQVTTTINLPK